MVTPEHIIAQVLSLRLTPNAKLVMLASYIAFPPASAESLTKLTGLDKFSVERAMVEIKRLPNVPKGSASSKPQKEKWNLLGLLKLYYSMVRAAEQPLTKQGTDLRQMRMLYRQYKPEDIADGIRSYFKTKEYLNAHKVVFTHFRYWFKQQQYAPAKSN